MSTEIASGASPRAGGTTVAARVLLLLIEVYRVTLAPLIGKYFK